MLQTISRFWRRTFFAPETLDAMGEVPGGWAYLQSGKPVRVSTFYLDIHPVTNRDYLSFIQDTGAKTPQWMYRSGFNDPDQPVVGITFADARQYARWIGKRLPTDPEWVKAGAWPIPTSSVPKQRKYPWGDQLDADRANLWDSDIGRTVPVTEYIRGASAAGHHQLVGNHHSKEGNR